MIPVSFRSILAVATLAGLLALTAPAAEPQATTFRIRSDFSAPLNADQGWAAEAGANATIFADQPFRLRLELEFSNANASAAAESFQLQYRRNAGEWTTLEAHDFPHPESDKAKTPRVSLVSCAAYKAGERTTDLLRGSRSPFQPGHGIGLTDRTPGSDPNRTAKHSEFEWALVVRRFADGAVTNEEGDTFEFRMVEARGAVVSSAPPPSVRLAIPPGHVGGTFVETPGRIGPWRAKNGDLYFIMEPAETSNLFLMIKSSDGGRSWREVDAAHRPPTRDLESVDARHVGDTIHILHQVTRSARYHAFRTSDHPTQPDTWGVTAETIGTPQSVAQAASLVVRDDGSMVSFYVGQTKIHYSLRGANGGAWREVGVIENAVGPQAVLGANGVVHLAYYQPDGTLWYRRLGTNGQLTSPEQIAAGLRTTRAEFVSVLPLVFLPRSNTAVIVYRLASGMLWERRVTNEAALTAPKQVTDRPVVQSAVDSQQPGADVFADDDALHVLFIEQQSRSIYSTSDVGGWQPSKLRVDRILGSWVRGSIYSRRDGTKVYGYIYDAGSDGGAGMNRFAEIVLSNR